MVPRTQTMKPPTMTGREYQLKSEITVSLQPRPLYPWMYYHPITYPVSLQEHRLKITNDMWNKCDFTATPPIPLSVVPTDLLSINKLNSGMAAALRPPSPIPFYTSFFLSLPSSTYSFFVLLVTFVPDHN
jgi:hypothetical protein